jgi:hypothetical protein
MEAVQGLRTEGSAVPGNSEGYALQHTAATLNQQLGLYLSEGQQRGLATGLLVGGVLAGAVVAWSVVTGVMRQTRGR